MKEIRLISCLLVLCASSFIGNAQWELLHSNLSGNNEAIQFFNECDGVLCGNEYIVNQYVGFIALTNDCGQTWDTVHWVTQALYDMHFPTENVGYACGFNTTIIKTIDGGQTWTNLNVSDDPDINWWHHLSTINFTDELNGLSGKNNGANILIRTNDGGETWTIEDQVNGCAEIVFPDFENGYAVSGGGGWLTMNGGEDWELFNFGFIDRSFKCGYFSNELENGIVGGLGWEGEVFQFNYACLAQSLDGGNSWVNRDVHEMQFINEIRFWSIQSGLAVGRNFIGNYNFLKTEDGGETWGWQEYENVAPDLVADVIAISLPTESTWYAVGSRGCIWKTTNAGGPPNYEFPYSTIGEVSVAETQDSQFKIYPNPSSGQVTFESDFKIEHVTVFDVTGRQVYTTSSRLSGKTYELTMNLPQGVYIVHGEGQGKRSTTTLVVQ